MPYITGLSGNSAGYFTDNLGSPRMYFADIPWGLPANAGRWNSGNYQADYDAYFAARAAQGYTAAVMHPWGHAHTGCNNSTGNTWDGVSPWTTIPALNNTFWTRLDYAFSSALANGITIFLDLTMACDLGVDAGFAGTGVWNGVSSANVQSACQNIAARYASQPNLVWMAGDDYNNNDDSGVFNPMIAGIRAAGDTRPIAVEYYPSGTTSRTDLSGSPTGSTFPWGAANATYNWCYYYWVSGWAVEQAYKENSQIPPVWGDGFFYTDGGGEPTDRHIARNMVWWALAAGARGVSLASETVYPWSSTSLSDVTGQLWQKNSALATYKAYTGIRDWHKLVPDLNSQLVTAGRGTRPAYNSGQFLGANLGTVNWVFASRTPGGTAALIYSAVAFNITIDQAMMQAGYTATWVDPATGATTPAATGSTYNSGSLGSNSEGDADWVLVLQGPNPQRAVAPVTTLAVSQSAARH